MYGFKIKIKITDIWIRDQSIFNVLGLAYAFMLLCSVSMACELQYRYVQVREITIKSIRAEKYEYELQYYNRFFLFSS